MQYQARQKSTKKYSLLAPNFFPDLSTGRAANNFQILEDTKIKKFCSDSKINLFRNLRKYLLQDNL